MYGFSRRRNLLGGARPSTMSQFWPVRSNAKLDWQTQRQEHGIQSRLSCVLIERTLVPMSEKMSHEQYVHAVRQQIVATAQAMLDGETTYLLGARKLAGLQHGAEVKDDDADFVMFVVIASDSDDFPLGSVRDRWDKQALAQLQPEIDRAEAWAREHTQSVCAKLIARFGKAGPEAI